MKHISILLPAGHAVLDTITGSLGLFKLANTHHRKIGKAKADLFKIDLVGLSHEPICYNHLFQVKPTKTIDELAKTDLILIPSITGDMEKGIAKNKPFIEWIKKQRMQHTAEIASLCKSAFLLAETGLLNGKSCATHWEVQEIFQKKYPKIKLVPEKIISEDNGIYSSGGAFSFLSLVLYLIERHYGRATAIWCSKIMEVDFDRRDQSHFIIFKGQKDHSDDSIKKAQVFIETNFKEKLNVEEIAKQFSVSRRNFIRRFKKATQNTPLQYIQRVRVEAAKNSMESSTLNINQIMYNVGYNDEKAFRQIFKKYTGLSPLKYRLKYNREMAIA